jgi:hypothetical protein
MNEDKIIQHIVELKLDINDIKEDVFEIKQKFVTRDEFLSLMDKHMAILQRLDQERIFTTEWVRRIEADVTRIKEHLHIQ